MEEKKNNMGLFWGISAAVLVVGCVVTGFICYNKGYNNGKAKCVTSSVLNTASNIISKGSDTMKDAFNTINDEMKETTNENDIANKVDDIFGKASEFIGNVAENMN